MKKPGEVSLIITDINGRNIAEVVSEYQHGGHQEVYYEPVDAARGFYFYHLTIGGKVAGSGKILRN
jgi:hypothetical protein